MGLINLKRERIGRLGETLRDFKREREGLERLSDILSDFKGDRDGRLRVIWSENNGDMRK